MPDMIRAYMERAAAGKAGEPIRFLASTSNAVRDGMIVEAAGWVLDNFRKNPVFLWAHGYWEPPVGKVTHIEVMDDTLVADVVFDQNDEFARKIESKYRDGILNAVSVGFDIKEFAPASHDNPIPRATKTELLELSAVPVPADPDALAARQQRSFRALGAELLKIADGDASGESADGEPSYETMTVTKINPDWHENRAAVTSMTVATGQTLTTAPNAATPAVRASWDETASAMLDLYRPYTLRPDDARRAEYDKLVRDYARHKKTPPEFATNAELEAFDAETLRGRFLEGEADLYPDRFAAMVSRAGAVLSRQNRDDLEQAIALMRGVLERAQKEADAAAHDDEERAAAAALRGLLSKLPPKGGK